MDRTLNEFGQPIGFPVPNWASPTFPSRQPLVGRYCRLEPLDALVHMGPLYEAYAGNDSGWTYLAYGPFPTLAGYREWVESVHTGSDPLFFAVLDHGKPVGVASYMRITPSAGSIEVGHLNFSPRLQRSRAATEAMYLMMKTAFVLGYRRYEWKCDALNALPERRQSTLDSHTRGRSARRLCIRNATGIRHGLPSSMGTGRSYSERSKRGSIQQTLIRRATSAPSCPSLPPL